MNIFLAVILLLYPAIYCISFVIHVLTRRPVGPIALSESYQPSVTVIIASAGEGERVLREKLGNTRSLAYRGDLLEIILFSDGRLFPAGLDRSAYPGVLFVEFEQLGKTECQNRSVSLAAGEIVLFTDVAAMLELDAVTKLVRWYADPRVGSVGGLFAYRFSAANVESAYVSREIRGKVAHGRYGIVTGYFGPLYSVRRVAYPVMPAFYPSDYMLPVIVSRGGLVNIMDGEARSFRVLQREMGQELVRKRRIIAQALAATLHFLCGIGRDWPRRADLVSAILLRKLLRWILMPYGLILCLALAYFSPSVFLIVSAAAGILLAGSLLYHRGGGQRHALLAPYYGALIAVATVLALYDVLRGEIYSSWNPGSR